MQKSLDRGTPPNLAKKSGNLKLVKTLLNWEVSLATGLLLYQVVKNDRESVIKSIPKIILDRADDDGNTALHLAAGSDWKL